MKMECKNIDIGAAASLRTTSCVRKSFDAHFPKTGREIRFLILVSESDMEWKVHTPTSFPQTRQKFEKMKRRVKASFLTTRLMSRRIFQSSHNNERSVHPAD